MADSVRRAAARGARTATRSRQRCEDAVEITMQRWADATVRGKGVRDWQQWAFRVAANAALKLRGSHSVAPVDDQSPAAVQAALEALDAAHSEDQAGVQSQLAGMRRMLRARLALHRNLLRGRQFEVLAHMAKQGMTFHRAAKELGMARFNVRRAFRSGLRRLRERGVAAPREPPPPPYQC